MPPTVPVPPGPAFNAAGSSEKLTAPTVPATPFPQYDVSVPIGPIPPGPFNPPFTLNTRTPFDTTPLRTRPFIRTRFGAVALCDRVFLEDKLWLGPVFRLLADGVSAPLLFGALGEAFERYVIRLIQFATTNGGAAGRSAVYANPKAGSLEITDVCVRAGPALVMIECKMAWLPQQAQWEYGDAAFIKAIRERLATYGKSNKGIGQLARSIVGTNPEYLSSESVEPNTNSRTTADGCRPACSSAARIVQRRAW